MALMHVQKPGDNAPIELISKTKQLSVADELENSMSLNVADELENGY